MPSQEILKIRDEILKIRDGTPLEIVARILVFKIRPSEEILKIRDGTPLEAEEILTYQKRPPKLLGLAFSSKLDVPSNVVQKKRVAQILVFKIRPSQEILKIRDGTPLEAEEILTYRKRVARILVFKIRPSEEILKIRDGTPLEAEEILTYQKRPPKLLGLAFSSKLDVPSNVVQKKRVARILVFKIRPSQEILKIRDGTPLEAEEILTYQKRPPKLLGLAFSSKLDVPSNVVHKKRVARILVFKIWPSQEILKIRDGTPLEAEGILTYQKRPPKLLEPSEEILKIRDGTPLEAEEILTYQKRPPKLLGLAFSSKLNVPSNVVQKKRVARILVFKIRPSQEILKIRDGNPLEAEGILTYQKRPPKLLEPSQEILKIRDGTPLEMPSQETLKIRDVARILVFKIRPSEEILKIRDGTPLEAEGILTYQKRPPKLLGLAFSSKLDVPSNVVQKKRMARILVFKIRPSQEILKIRDGTPLEAEGILTDQKRPPKLLVARILVFKIRPSEEILKIRDGTPLEAEEILTYQKRPPKLLGLAFSSKLDVPSNVVQKKRVARILVFKIRPSQEILKIRDGTPLEAEEILTYQKRPPKLLGLAFSSKLDVPSNVVHKKRVARILVFKIWPSQEILKIRDGTPLEAEGILTYQKRVARILVFKIRPSEEILKIRDGTPLEAEEILTYQKRPPKLLGLAFSSKLNVPSNVVQKKRVARILVFKIRPSQEILKIRDGNPLEAEGILTYQKRPSEEILKIRDGTPLEAEGILTYQKRPPKLLGLAFSSKLDVPSNVVQKKRMARILVFKIRPSQEILKIRDGTPLEAEGILTDQKRPPKLLGLALF
ncbi:hypothetical protein OROMI_034421 [Orobanche minor]